MAAKKKTGEHPAIKQFAADANAILNVDSSLIDWDWKWNVRSPKIAKGTNEIIGVQGDPANPEKGVFSFKDLVKSVDDGFDEAGQRAAHEAVKSETPFVFDKTLAEGSGIKEVLICRVNPDHKKGSKPLILVDGFSRITAADKAARKRGLSSFNVRVIVKDMNEREAIKYALGSVNSRKDLEACDKVGAVQKYLRMTEEAGIKETQQEAADAVVMSPQYYGKLLTIIKGIKDEDMIDEWRNSSVDIPYVKMLKLVTDNTSKTTQRKAMDLLLHPVVTPPGDGGRGGWAERAKTEARLQGFRLGTAEKDGGIALIKGKGSEDFFTKFVPLFVKINAAPTGDAAAKKVGGKGKNAGLTQAQQHGGFVADIIAEFREGHKRGKAGQPVTDEKPN